MLFSFSLLFFPHNYKWSVFFRTIFCNLFYIWSISCCFTLNIKRKFIFSFCNIDFALSRFLFSDLELLSPLYPRLVKSLIISNSKLLPLVLDFFAWKCLLVFISTHSHWKPSFDLLLGLLHLILIAATLNPVALEANSKLLYLVILPSLSVI